MSKNFKVEIERYFKRLLYSICLLLIGKSCQGEQVIPVSIEQAVPVFRENC
jgi:hypothetical protein